MRSSHRFSRIFPGVALLSVGIIAFLLSWRDQSKNLDSNAVDGDRERVESNRSVSRLSHLYQSVESTERDPELEHLISAFDLGLPVKFVLGDASSKKLILRPRPLFSELFRFSLGPNIDASPAAVDVRSYEGRILDQNPNGASFAPGDVSVVVINNAIAAVIRDGARDITYVRTNSETGALEATVQKHGVVELGCAPGSDGEYVVSTENGLPFEPGALWKEAQPAAMVSEEVPEVAALTGFDPTTGELDKYVDPIPLGQRYAASLKDALLMLVLDKEASGPDDPDSLAARASIYLATISNVAAAYENQLGVRLLLSELIMIPDSASYDDLTVSDNLNDFRSWVSRHRPRNRFGWTMASKYGAGLTNRVLGVAFVGALGSSNAVSICDSSGLWDVIAHEVGHNMGSGHSTGGIMNASSLGGNNRSFFTDVTSGETAAKDIYDHSANQLIGSAVLRNPEQMPFANRDSRTTTVGVPVQFNPIGNDAESVRNGAINTLSLDEVGSVSPIGEGTVEIIGNEVRFVPSEDFTGVTWFSYTLRGSVGNNGEGWLHKGDVGIRVGSAPDPQRIEMPAGGTYSFRIPRTTSQSGIVQPAQADVVVSRDDSRLIIVRAEGSATGTDSFSAGGTSYTLIYDNDGPQTQPDFFVFDPSEDSLEFSPLLNDGGAGERWLHEIRPVYGVGTVGVSSTGVSLFGTSFRLISARMISGEKGTIQLPVRSVVINGVRTGVPSGSIIFTPAPSVSGIAQIEYRVEDATGRQATGSVEISLVPIRRESLLITGAATRVFIPENAGNESVWMSSGFDDSGWIQGTTGIGYERRNGFESLIATDVSEIFGVRTGVWLRIPFSVSRARQFSSMTLAMQYDDGFIAYLNGVEVARSNAAGEAPIAWDANASRTNSDSRAENFEPFDITSHLDLLNDGENILAIHGLNENPQSSDFLIVPTLSATIIGEGADIVSPETALAFVPENVGLSLEGRALGDDGGSSVHWSLVEGPAGGVVDFEDANKEVTGARFSIQGEYEIKFSADNLETGALTEDRVTVVYGGELSSPGAVGVFVRAGESQVVEELKASLSGEVASSEAASEWQLVSGPGHAIFVDDRSAETTVLFTEGGDYRLRLLAEREGVRTYHDVELTVGIAPSAVIFPAADITDSSARLSGLAAGVSNDATVLWYVGTKDGGTDVDQWERVVVSGSSDGNLESVVVDELLFDSAYVYRMAVRSNGTTVWSDLGSARTRPPKPLSQILLAENSPGKVIVPLSDADGDGTGWRLDSFDDSGWTSGPTGIGFDRASDFDPFIATDIEAEMFNVNTTAYIRVPFELSVDLEQVESLALRMRYDDAFVAFVNGSEVARSDTAPAMDQLLAWNTAAVELRDDADAVQFEDFDITDSIELLRLGGNLLAVHGLNFIPENRDLLISPEVVVVLRTSHFSRWAESHGLIGDLGLPEADPDKDTISNFHEFVFNGNPVRPESPASLLPTIASSDNGTMQFEFRRRRDADEAGIRYVVERSDALQTWISLDLEAPEMRVSNLGRGSGPSPIETVAVTFNDPVIESYLRLRVELSED
jgi:hypothetical protein